MKILLIEDKLEQADNIIRALTAAGHQVTHLIGVTKRRADHFAGLNRDKVEETIDLAEYPVALVDGILEGNLRGWDIIPQLAWDSDKICIGISSEDTFNKKLVDSGALFGVLKNEVPTRMPGIIADIEKRLASGEPVTHAVAGSPALATAASHLVPGRHSNVPAKGGGALGALRRKWANKRR